jgi:hypothetical protein
MDPFIEGRTWRDFHTALLVELRKALVPAVRPRYVVHVEEYVYLASEPDAPEKLLAPDMSISAVSKTWQSNPVSTAEGGLLVQSVVRQTPMPERYEQTFLEIRTRDGAEVVTVIELLSPWNKAPGAGRTEYLNKRHNVFAAPANLVELDLLRGGERLPTTAPLPRGDYYAFVSRRDQLPDVEVFAWSLRDKLPRLPIPLAEDDADAIIDLQAAFTIAYDDAGYDYALDYGGSLSPRLSADDEQWLATTLQANRKV